MSHPITGRQRSLLIYGLVWLVMAALNGTLVWYFQRFPASLIITDSLLSNLIFAFLGLLAWYPTRYIPFHKHTPIYSVLTHIVAGLLVLATWMFVSVGLLSVFFSQDAVYIEFLKQLPGMEGNAWRNDLPGAYPCVLPGFLS